MANRRWSRVTKRQRAAIGVTLLIVAAGTVWLIARPHLFARKFQRIRAGDSRDTVRAVLGEPTDVFTPSPDVPGTLNLGVRVETWAYGRVFEWNVATEFPFFWPFKFRLFGPDSDDFAIEFDANGQVQRLVMPSE